MSGVKELEHVDDSVLAAHLLDRLGIPVKYDRGTLWVYRGGDKATGAWTEWELSEARNNAARVLTDVVEVKERDESTGRATKRVRVKADQCRVRAVVARMIDIVTDKGWLDAAPPCIVLRDAVLTLSPTGEVERHDHDPRWGATSAFDVEWDPAATTPTWGRALAEWFEGDEDAAGKIRALQEFGGACLFGIAARYQRALCLKGEGANGKSIFLAVLRDLFPASDRASVTPQAMSGRSGEYYRAALAGKRLNVVPEMPGSALLEASEFKAIIVGDAVMGRSAYGHPFEFESKAGHVFSANELPRSMDHTQGFWRRWLIVPFNRTFPVGPRGAEIQAACGSAERAGLINWLIEGAQRLVRRGHFEETASHAASIVEWEVDSNVVKTWAAERLVQGDDHWSSTKALHQDFVDWAKETGHKPMARGTFAKRLGRFCEKQDLRSARGFNASVVVT